MRRYTLGLLIPTTRGLFALRHPLDEPSLVLPHSKEANVASGATKIKAKTGTPAAAAAAAAEFLPAPTDKVGTDEECTPRQMMLFKSRNDGSNCIR